MKLQVLLTLFVVLIFSGCATKYKYLPTQCHVPVSKCATSEQMQFMTYEAIILEMKRCIEEHKENEKVCQ